MPFRTPFHDRTAALNESHEWRDWSGYLAAGTYEPSHEREYYAIRNAAALIDVSPLFKYEVEGPDALRLLNKVMTRDLGRCGVGQIIYSPWCDEDGKLIDDGTVWRLADNYFFVTAADPSWRWFVDCAFGMDVEVRDVSRRTAALAVQGPNARRILCQVILDVDFGSLGYYQLAHGHLDGVPVTVTRTGYTGDLGYELWVAPKHACLLWDAVAAAGQDYGVLPAGMVALDLARIEAGLLLIEVDYVSSLKALTSARKSSPYEAGLGWTVALDKGPFVGRKALAAEKAAGSAWALVGLEIDWPALEALFARFDLPPLVAGRASRVAVPLYDGSGRQIGQATSLAFSPLLKRYIALATVETAFARPGTALQVEITVEYTRQRGPATVVRLPFYNPPWKKE